jgi:hypothetical protein
MIDQKIEFNIKGVDYTIGTVTLEHYYKIHPFIEVDDLESHFTIVSELANCDINLLKTLSSKNWHLLWASVVGMLNSYFQQDINKIIQEMEHLGVKYGLVNMNDMTIGEFSDLDIIANSDNLSTRYHEMLAIMYRPIRKKNLFTKEIVPYDEINFTEQCEIMKTLPLYYVKSIISFFLLSANQSFENTVNYLLNLTQQMNLSQEESKAMKSMVLGLQETGGPLLTPLQLKIPQDFIKLPSLELGKVSTGWLGNKTKSKRNVKL